MDLRQLPALNAIKAFEAAARHESFSRAADELFVTHGAVSHQIRALEAELGAKLFARDGKRVRLTEIGRRYAAQVRSALTALAEATREIRAGDRERRLVVSMLSSFAARWVTPRIGSFIEAHPQWDLELLSTNSLTDFARDDVDAAIRFGFGKYPGLHAELLLEEISSPPARPISTAASCRKSRPTSPKSRSCAPTTNCGARGSTPRASPTGPSRNAACCIRIHRTCCRRPSTARASRLRAARSPCTRSPRGASCGYSTWMVPARGSTTSSARRKACRRKECGRSGIGSSRKSDSLNSSSTRRAPPGAQTAADALHVAP